MKRACSKCGRVHNWNEKCPSFKREYQDSEERRLRSKNKWTQKSLDIRERANFLCEVCRDQGLYTYDGVQVHHIVKLRTHSDGLLDDNNLVCLCPEHHRQADNGEISQEYLRELVKRREGEIPPTT